MKEKYRFRVRFHVVWTNPNTQIYILVIKHNKIYNSTVNDETCKSWRDQLVHLIPVNTITGT